MGSGGVSAWLPPADRCRQRVRTGVCTCLTCTTALRQAKRRMCYTMGPLTQDTCSRAATALVHGRPRPIRPHGPWILDAMELLVPFNLPWLTPADTELLDGAQCHAGGHRWLSSRLEHRVVPAAAVSPVSHSDLGHTRWPAATGYNPGFSSWWKLPHPVSWVLTWLHAWCPTAGC